MGPSRPGPLAPSGRMYGAAFQSAPILEKESAVFSADLERDAVHCERHDARRIALGTAVEVQREAVDPRGLNLDLIGARQARVDRGERAGRQSVELDPIGGAVLVAARAEAHPFRKAFPFEPGEPVEDGRAAIRVVPGIVPYSGILRVLDPALPLPETCPAISAPSRASPAGPARLGTAARARSTRCRPVPPCRAAGSGQTGAIAAHTSGRVSPSHNAPPPPIAGPVR